MSRSGVIVVEWDKKDKACMVCRIRLGSGILPPDFCPGTCVMKKV